MRIFFFSNSSPEKCWGITVKLSMFYIGTFLEIEDFESELCYMQGHLIFR